MFEILPFPSSKVQVTTVVPCVAIGKIVVVVPVIIPEQLSTAVGAIGVAEHSVVKSVNTGATGAVVSVIIIF